MIAGYNKTLQLLRYTFSPMYHPYTALFLRELKRNGLEGLLNRKIQLNPQTFYPGNSFSFGQYGPTASAVGAPTARRTRSSTSTGPGAYSVYNWETFFHAPLAIATKLSQNQRFEEAMRWFHFIFDPTNTDALPSPQRFWVTKPFYEQNADDYRKQRIEQLLDHIVDNTEQLNAWKNNPFDPHLIARFRPVAYQKQRRDEVHRQPHRLGRQPVPPGHDRGDQRGHARCTCWPTSCSATAAGAGAEHRPRRPVVQRAHRRRRARPVRQRQGRGARREPGRLARCRWCGPTTAPSRCRCWRSATSASRPTTSCSATGTPSPTGCSRSATA